MIKLTAENYKKDKYYPKVVSAMTDELIQSDFVSPISVFQQMALLDKRDVELWKKGKIIYLEKVIKCNLSKANRILRLMRFHGHDLNMKPSIKIYKRKLKSTNIVLKFSKTGEPKIEEAYSRHFVKTWRTV
jgi:hypothetical protein